MKTNINAKFRVLVSLAVMVITMNAYSQRTIFFGNRVPWTTPPIDNTSRPIYYFWNGVNGEGALGTKLMNDATHVYKAQLYFSLNTDLWNSYVEPVNSTPRNFYSTEALAGFFSTASTPLVSVYGTVLSPGIPAKLQVRIWDSGNNTYNTYEDARNAGLTCGKSLTFLLGPTDMYMEGFQSFGLVPEPTSLALVVLGGGMAWVWRRMRCEGGTH